MAVRLLPVALMLLLAPTTRPGEYASTSSYERRDVEGWTVYVAEDLREGHPELTAKVLTLLRAKLIEVAHALPVAAVEKLRGVPVWVELDEPRFPGMCYHPSPEWLRGNGFSPDKAGGVEIGNARNFLSWSRQQPSMVLHEMAHAYHHQVLGYGHAGVRAAYENAKASGTYESVLHIVGRTERAYALNNDQEYFAECSEAFFGTNDFFPFVRAELERHDPGMAETLRQVWGVKR